MTEIIETVLDIAAGAGTLILEHYDSKASLGLTVKIDGSPLTNADRESHRYILERLEAEFRWPILSEEAPIQFEERKNWSRFWLVDPLDGTKDFLAGNGEFAVNIALVENGLPIAGVIYAPAIHEVYYAGLGLGAYQIKGGAKSPLPRQSLADKCAGISRFHDSTLNQEFVELNNIASTAAFGASLKFGKLAAGEINIYPRFVGSSEWDIAAGQVIVKEAGGFIVDLKTLREPIFNKPTLRNNHFLAFTKQFTFSDFKIPGENK